MRNRFFLEYIFFKKTKLKRKKIRSINLIKYIYKLNAENNPPPWFPTPELS